MRAAAAGPRTVPAAVGRRELLAFAALAAAVRVLVAGATVMPARDGATYLWMAERVVAGDVGGAFTTVFHPLYPLLTGAMLAVVPGLPPMAAGQLVAAGCGALAVVPLQAMAAHRFGPGAGRLAAILYAFGLWFCRYPAECQSEGCFFAAVAVWAWALFGARRRPVVAGAAAAAAYATRPEGLALLALGWLRLHRRRRGVGRFLATGLLAAAMVPLGYAVWGPGWTLTPKAVFNYEVGIGAAASPLAHYATHGLRAVGTAFEVVGYLVLPLALLALGRRCRRHGCRGAAPWLAAPFAVQLAVVPLLRSHVRFLAGFGLLLLPLAGAALAKLGRGWRPALRAAAVLLVLLPDLVRLPATRGADRLVERRVGEWLRPRLRAGDTVASDLPRFEYFAGLRPGPPRALTRDELLAAAASPRARYAVLVGPRSGVGAGDLERLGFRPLSLPESLSAMARQRALLVYERR
jgi:hypothetical protein